MEDDMKQQKNLRMIQKMVPGASCIRDQANYVAVYTFNEADQSWEKEDIEGPFFLVERTAGVNDIKESCAIVVVNRNSSSNLVKYAGSDFEFDATEEYLMFRLPEGIFGIWFAVSEEQGRVIRNLETMINESKDRESKTRGNPTNPGDMPAILQQLFLSEQAKEKGKDSEPEQAPSSFTGPNASENFVLSKEQMKDVLLRLVQTEKFVDILHSTYLKSVQPKQHPGTPQQQPQHAPPHNMVMHGHSHGHVISPSPLRQPPMFNMPPGAHLYGMAPPPAPSNSSYPMYGHPPQ